MHKNLFIGLMSGTSIDSLDAALCYITDSEFKLISSHTIKWDLESQSLLHSLCGPGDNEIEKMATASNIVAEHQSRLINELLLKSGLKSCDITAVGSHGQTVRHLPHLSFSLQLDNGALTACRTGIDTICNFRAADLARHGQGAPLTPIFHKLVLSSKQNFRLVLNLGGISNITAIDTKGNILCGFDAGPANTLMDLCTRELFNIPYDKDAQLALKGYTDDSILNELMNHKFLKRDFPKSTGREDFNLSTIKNYIDRCKAGDLNSHSLLHTLCSFSALCVKIHVKKIIEKFSVDTGGELILCGGGALNPLLCSMLQKDMLSFGYKTILSSDLGIDPSYIEAQAFAYFAYLFTEGQSVNIHDCTGAQKPYIMGCLYPATDGFYARSLL